MRKLILVVTLALLIPLTANAKSIPEDDKNLLAKLCLAEAEGETTLGKRLVIDTVLNRVDSDDFPDTVEDVIFDPSQFTSVNNGRLKKCGLDDEIMNLIEEEIECRTNEEVIFFNNTNYSSFGEPAFKHGNHYFSKMK